MLRTAMCTMALALALVACGTPAADPPTETADASTEADVDEVDEADGDGEPTEPDAEPDEEPVASEPTDDGAAAAGDEEAEGDEEADDVVAAVPLAPEPCELLSSDEVSTAVGEQVGDPDPFEFDAEGVTVRVCSWEPTGSGGGQYSLAVSDEREWDGQKVADFMAAQRDGATELTELADLGDDAFIDEFGVWVAQGPLVVSADASHRPGEDVLGLVQAALAALDH